MTPKPVTLWAAYDLDGSILRAGSTRLAPSEKPWILLSDRPELMKKFKNIGCFIRRVRVTPLPVRRGKK